MTIDVARKQRASPETTGLTDDKLERIIGVIMGSPDDAARVDQVILFGSRAKGTWREGSDIDLAVTGRGLSREDVWRWKDVLEDALFPWTPDILLVDRDTNSDIVEHIARVGVVLSGRTFG
jgi:uncharacterized protein